MRMIGIETVVIVGAVTEACVASTAREAWDLGYKVILMNDATAGLSEDEHNHTMRNFAIFFGKVMDTDNIISVISEKL